MYLSGGTVITSGTITGGSGGAAVQFGTNAAKLIIDPGAVFNGLVAANATVADVLELSGTSPSFLTGVGMEFTNFNTIAVDAGADWLLAGTNHIGAGETLANNGKLAVDSSFSNSGTIVGGVTLLADATVANAAGASITNAASAAVYSAGSGVSLNNNGTIAGGVSGIELMGGGSVTNAASGSINGSGSGGGSGIYIRGGSGTVLNDGSITGSAPLGADGIFLGAGGSVTNAASGSITTNYSNGMGVDITGGAGTVINFGTIAAQTSVGLVLGGSVTNMAGASMLNVEIEGTTGVVTNYGAMGAISLMRSTIAWCWAPDSRYLDRSLLTRAPTIRWSLPQGHPPALYLASAPSSQISIPSRSMPAPRGSSRATLRAWPGSSAVSPSATRSR